MKRNHYYQSYVLKDKIEIDGDTIKDSSGSSMTLRYRLFVTLNNESNKSVLVILKNPSVADQENSDRTINNVLKFCNSEGYKKVHIMNLYAYYSTNPLGLKTQIKAGNESLIIGKKSNCIMRSTISKVNEVIFAWGTNTFACTKEYKKRIVEVVSLIKSEGKPIFYVQSMSKCGTYPRHAQVWHVNQGIKKHEWVT